MTSKKRTSFVRIESFFPPTPLHTHTCTPSVRSLSVSVSWPGFPLLVEWVLRMMESSPAFEDYMKRRVGILSFVFCVFGFGVWGGFLVQDRVPLICTTVRFYNLLLTRVDVRRGFLFAGPSLNAVTSRWVPPAQREVASSERWSWCLAYEVVPFNLAFPTICFPCANLQR